MKVLLFFFLFIYVFSTSWAQTQLKNGSFEGIPKDASMPAHWKACSAGSTPDILPGFWDVNLEPKDGNSYVGLITREDGSYEAIGQKVPTLKKYNCYAFSIDVAHSSKYAGYSLPVRLRIWGGNEDCKKSQLLGEIRIVTHENWKTYDFSFTAVNDINFIIVEAYYVKGMLYDYRGNILLDNITPFENCDRAELYFLKGKYWEIEDYDQI